MADREEYHINPDTGKRDCTYNAEDGAEPPHVHLILERFNFLPSTPYS